MIRLLLTTALLTACTTSDPAAGDETSCNTFVDDPAYVYAGGKVTVDVTGIDYVDLLGTPFFVPPKGASEGARDSTMVEPGRWSVLAVSWRGMFGKAVVLNGGSNRCAWVERL